MTDSKVYINVRIGGARRCTNDVSLVMVKTGNAWHYSYFDKTSEYVEAEARVARRGLWSQDKRDGGAEERS